MFVATFPHDGPVYVAYDDRFEVAYYSLDGKKYKRTCELGLQTWPETTPQEITPDHFYMVIACLERRKER